MPSDPWRELAEDEAPLAALLCGSAASAGQLERLAREAASPLVRKLARIALEELEHECVPEDPLVGGLASPDPLVRLASARALASSARTAHLPSLKRSFIGETTPAVRTELLESIAFAGGPEQWPFLAGAFKDADRAVRLKVIELAARLADKQALVSFTLQALRDPEPEVRERALGLLMVAGARQAAERKAAAETPGAESPVASTCTGFSENPVQVDATGFSLAGPLTFDAAEQWALARRLAREPDLEMLPVLRELARVSPSPDVVSEALRALAVVGGTGELDPIRAGLDCADPVIVAGALLALGHLADRRDIAVARLHALPGSPQALRAAAFAYLIAAGEAPELPAGPIEDYARSTAELLAAGRLADIELHRPPPLLDTASALSLVSTAVALLLIGMALFLANR
ncbi:MAG: HEAT repeat domain-containing protein [Candidatus Wallbacteria bacterium]|nr:HEAT repeat domain-containing protein [Candidatus Wallbacteria bacterium]